MRGHTGNLSEGYTGASDGMTPLDGSTPVPPWRALELSRGVARFLGSGCPVPRGTAVVKVGGGQPEPRKRAAGQSERSEGDALDPATLELGRVAQRVLPLRSHRIHSQSLSVP